MAAVNLKPNLLETLKTEVGVAELDGSEQIFLTPYLALACSLLYMMASDGELEAQESSQLQAVLGKDKAVLSYALRYVQSVPVEQFFATASELLSVKDKWCILTNVCDALLADGHADQAELALFGEMAVAFGVREAQFEPYFKILALKYVRAVKLKQFLDEASALLRPEQKIYILTNVCDSMLSDGEVAHLEDKLFLSMLTAFGFTEKTFAHYLQVLETKNFKPFDTSEFKNRVTHDRLTGNEDASGITFKNELTDVNSTTANSFADAANQGVWVGAAGNSEMSQFIACTMEDNIQSVSDDFGNQSNVVKVGLNATDGLNLQTLGESEAINNRQRLDAASSADNVQQIDVSAQDVNRQSIASADGITNRQSIDVNGTDANLQTLDVDVHDAHRESISPELRLQNIHEVTQEVHHRLDRFEVAHSRFLQIGRAQKFTDAFVLLEDDPSDINRQLVDASCARMGLDLSLASAGVEAATDVMLEVQVVEVFEDAVGNDVESQELITVPMASSSNADAFTVLVNREGQAESMGLSRAWGVYRGRGFACIQLVVATFAIVFAAPIETRSMLRRSVAGPLIMMPIVMHESDEQRDVEPFSVQGDLAPR